MPRGFLVKRSKKATAGYSSWRIRRNSEEDRTASDSGSDHENNCAAAYTAFGSPDSGFSQSPLSLTMRDTVLGNINNNNNINNGHCGRDDVGKAVNNNNNNNNNGGGGGAYGRGGKSLMGSSPSTPSSSPLSIVPGYSSPFYFTSFDRLSVSSPTGKLASAPSPGSTASSPASPSKKRNADSMADQPKGKTPKKPKAVRKITFDEDKSSPVSGTIIRDFSDTEEDGAHVVCGDIEPSLNLVDISPEARADLAKIENKIGDFVCMLCKECYVDAFQLAQHKCSRIVHVEYRCPECDKVFSCPANLASHRRWHKPRPAKNGAQVKVPPPPAAAALAGPASPGKEADRQTPSPSALSTFSNQSDEGHFECETCGKRFKRQAYLRKHAANHVAGGVDERAYPCQFCGKMFKSEANRAKHVVQHQQVHHGPTAAHHQPPSATVPVKELTCPVCSTTHPNKLLLEQHMKAHGAGELFNCKYCSSSFCSSPGLTRHINKCHPSENRQVILLQLPVNRPC